MSDISFDANLKVCCGVHMREEDFGAIVVSSSCPSLCLNKDAVAILNFCKEGLSINEMTEKLTCNNDGGQKNQLATKISEIISMFFKAGIVGIA